ncbi:transketolase [Microbulbifer variabilis]|uniref:transketolase n=1 Tax=Microbulbifer variabilis TaxID=266805 RepID=UPI001CFE9FF0|nr:transketolase [Microbulbifer variabilis]
MPSTYSRTDMANALRALSMDAVQKANSGHPGTPMGMADIAEVLWNDYLKHNPANPKWADRDRFVLSNGHGSILLYSLLHLSGYDLSIEELKSFCQLHSKTPGHPEYGYTPGVEATTGPLGQGIANAAGMALAEKTLAAHFNRPGYELVNHHTYVFMGDGCLMEGISHEACSLAGTLGLGKLIAFYDDNGISDDGDVEGWFTDDTLKRFESYGWHTIPNLNGHDATAIKSAIEKALSVTDKPTIICCQTVIGFGSPNKQGRKECHGEPLGDDEIALVLKAIDWTPAPFEIPEDIYAGWNAKAKGEAQNDEWKSILSNYCEEFPYLAVEFERRVSGELPVGFFAKADEYIKLCQKDGKKISSREASQNALNAYAPLLPELLGGSADLSGPCFSLWSGSKNISAQDASGNYVHYGIREFGMSAMMNGIALHGGFIPYGATFLVFMDYARSAVRMAALMKQRVIFIYTHDSIGLGENGPTHQPVEQLGTLRSTPNLHTWRPCDTTESAVSWKMTIARKKGPSVLVFSRQELEPQKRNTVQLAQIEKGGYVLSDCEGTPEVIIIATGSEVSQAVATQKKLTDKRVRVVSMPCVEAFMEQKESYRESVLPTSVRTRVAEEAGHKNYWYKFVGLEGGIVGMSTFGESAPGHELMQYFGFTTDNLIKTIEKLLK